MNDTSSDIQEKYRKLIMEKSPSERIRMACRMFSTARALMIAGIQGEIPDDEIPYWLFQRLYGDESPTVRQQIRNK